MSQLTAQSDNTAQAGGAPPSPFSVTTGGFLAPKFQWLLRGSELDGRNYGSVPMPAGRGKWKRTFAANPENRKQPFVIRK